jgi:hypothetical protein
MKIKKAFKIVVVCFVFCASYLGVTYSTRSKKVANEQINVSIFSLSTQAKAYCNEAAAGETNDGACSGDPNDSKSRCLCSETVFNCTGAVSL